jgi:hypothetical protein
MRSAAEHPRILLKMQIRRSFAPLRMTRYVDLFKPSEGMLWRPVVELDSLFVGLQSGRNIRFFEILALEQQRFAGHHGEGIREAIAEIESCRMARPLPKSWNAWRAICA